MKTDFPLKTFLAPDGVKIRYAIHYSDRYPHRGKVLLLNGRSEFIEKYHETIQELNRRGLQVYTFDWRGQGLSDRMLPDRRKGYVRSYREYLNDLKQFIDKFVKHGDESPLLVLAHSMGGHIALRFCREYPGIMNNVVLTSPLIDLAGSVIARQAIRAIARIAVKSGFRERNAAKRGADLSPSHQHFQKNRLTHDPERFGRTQEIMQRNPDLIVEGVTFGWLDATFDSLHRLSSRGYAEGIDLPIQFITAGSDRVVSVRAQKEICRKLPNARMVEIPGAWHEILMETDEVRNAFWHAFDQFSEMHHIAT